MKRLILLAVALVALVLAGPRAQATLEVSAGVTIRAASDFYEPLAAHGAWVDVHSYGRCWRPTGVYAGWQPYCDGHWEWTDCGWFWVSAEPWAWACYHYGRWEFESDYGWIWIPEIEWAPAWVYWRVSDRHIGWAPCPPRGGAVADARFVFVEGAHFRDPVSHTTVIINNPGIIHETKLITKTQRTTRDIAGVGRQKVVINNGPGLSRVEKVSGQKFDRVPIHQAALQARMPERRMDKVVTPDVKAPAPEPRREIEHNVPAPQPPIERPAPPREQPAPPPVREPNPIAPRPEPRDPDKSGVDQHEDRSNHGEQDHGPGRDHDKDGH